MKTEQLQVMVKNLRAECGHSLSIAQGINQEETLKYLLARTQEELWTAFTWPELRSRVEAGIAGAYQYTYPAGVTFDTIREVYTVPNTGIGITEAWLPVEYGISQDKIRPGGVNSESGDPVRYWDVESPTQYRIWPSPISATGVLRFVCQKPIAAFLANSDVSTIDSTCIVMFAAAGVLARSKAEDADMKMQQAQRHLTKLLGNKINAKNKVSTLGGGAPNRRAPGANLMFGRGF